MLRAANAENTEEKGRAAVNLTDAAILGINCFATFSRKRAAVSFTSGKDCHLAMHRSIDAGLEVVCTVAFQANGHSVETHRIEWQHIQTQAMEIPLCVCAC